VKTTGIQINSGTFGTGSLFSKLVPQLPGIVTNLVIPILAALMVAALILGRFPPRTSWRRWLKQPGVLGPLAVLAAITIDGSWYAAIQMANPRSYPHVIQSAISRWGNLGFVALIASWSTVWLPGRWVRPSSWPERLGFCLGIAWLGCWLLAMVASVIWSAMR